MPARDAKRVAKLNDILRACETKDGRAALHRKAESMSDRLRLRNDVVCTLAGVLGVGIYLVLGGLIIVGWLEALDLLAILL